jgi:hypothetical protein
MLDRSGVINPGDYDDFYLMIYNPTYDDDLGECEAISYDLRIEPTSEDAAGRLSETRFRSFDGKFMRERIRVFDEKVLAGQEWGSQ